MLKRTGLTNETIEALKPLLKREIPYHLEELRLYDIKINSNTTSILLTTLERKCSLKSLSLVSFKLNET